MRGAKSTSDTTRQSSDQTVSTDVRYWLLTNLNVNTRLTTIELSNYHIGRYAALSEAITIADCSTDSFCIG